MLYKFADLELKFDEAKTGTFEGYASTFGNVDTYGDTVQPGAFAKSLRSGRDVLMHWNHGSNDVIGKWLSLEEDTTGLYVKGELTPGHTVADNCYAAMKHGTVHALSIGYFDRKSTPNVHGGRTLAEIDLFEISPVLRPADSHAQLTSVKSEIESLDSLKQCEGFLRGPRNLSKSEVTALVARIKALAGDGGAALEAMAAQRNSMIAADLRALML